MPNREEALSPVEEGLGDAFGGDDTSFTETMTGIVSTVTKSISGRKKEKEPKQEAAAPAPADSGDSSSFSPKLLGIGAVAVVAIAAVGFWVFGGSDETGLSKPRPAPTSTVSEESPDFGSRTEQPSVDIDELLEEARLARDRLVRTQPTLRVPRESG